MMSSPSTRSSPRWRGGKDAVAFECRQVCADGSVRWLEWHTETCPEQGVVYGIGRDVTDRRVANAELKALRRVATLVAEGVKPEELFAVVADEVRRVVHVPFVSIVCYEADGSATERASSSKRGAVFQVGTRWSLDGTNVVASVRETARPARIDDYSGLEGTIAETVRRAGIRSTVGIPIVVAGRLWGAMVVSSAALEPLPEDTEARLADFTQCSQPRSQMPSRVRLSDASSTSRRRCAALRHWSREVFRRPRSSRRSARRSVVFSRA
jgi:hypothetical protein